MRRLAALVLLVGGSCTPREYWLDWENPANLNSRIDVFVDAPARMAPGSATAIRVVATENRERPAGDLPVDVRLVDAKDRAVRLFEGKAVRGECVARFVVPELPDGNYTLKIRTKDYELKHAVSLKRDERILLNTDKPLYQPGQRIRLRALALSNVTLKPVAGRALTFEIEDAKGNKVFKRRAKTSEFGVASAEFALADEVIMGNYKVTALLGTLSSSRTVVVKRYVLPKYRVTLAIDRPFYLPGERLTGTVEAGYLFGKPVNGEVALKLVVIEAQVREVAQARGKLSPDGRYRFEIPLPNYFVGLPINKGMANVLLAAEVTDTAGHKEKAARPIPVAKEALQVAAVPEGGRLVPGVENRVYVAAFTPDGSPAPSEITLRVGGWRGTRKTDASGIAIFSFRPGPGGWSAIIDARDETGRRVESQVNLIGERAPGGLLLRPDRALYTSGETMDLRVYSTVRKGTIFLDLIRQGRTLYTETLLLQKGAARRAFDIPTDVTGAVEVRAYCIMPTGVILRDSRLVYVRPAEALRIRFRPDRDVYRPGEDAVIRFDVTGPKGPVRAAMAVSLIDEAVFALQEMRPGLERVYFTLEKELLTPRYGIKTLPEAIERRLDPVAAMIFASATTPVSYGGRPTRWVVNTLEQRGRVMGPRLRRWYAALEQAIFERKIPFAVRRNGAWEFHPSFFWRASQSDLLRWRDQYDAWGNRTTLETLANLDPRFRIEHWLERRKP